MADIDALIGFTRDGSLFYSSSTNLSDIETVKLDPATFKPVGTPAPFLRTFLGRNHALSFSPDGKWAAWRSDRGIPESLVVRPSAGGEEKDVYRNGGMFRWLPDSEALLIHRAGGMESLLDRVSASDGRVQEIGWGMFTAGLPSVIGKDNREYFWARCKAGACELARVNTATKEETVERLEGITERGPMAISPDGKWLALLGVSPARRNNSIFIRHTAPGGKLVEVAQGVERVPGDYTFAFIPDSSAIVYTSIQPAHELLAVPLSGGAPVSTGLQGEFPSFHPDGRLAYTKTTNRVETWMLRNLSLK